MAAHLAVHALEQHGHRPSTYPLLRALADLADLSDHYDGDLAGSAAPFLAESLAGDEIDAVFQLATLLAEGNSPEPANPTHRGAETLLRHIVAGTLDADYRASLAIQHTAGRLREARRDGELMRYIAQKFGGSREADAEGSTQRRNPFLGQLLHSFYLIARFAAAGAARMRRIFDR
jgi:hypothetical protein